MAEKMRLFIAVHVDVPILNKIAKFVKPFKEKYKSVKWVPIENMHLTLKFLGDVQNDLVEEIQDRLSLIDSPAFNLKLINVGAFPNMRSPKIFWIGIEEEEDLFTQLFNNVEDQLEHLDFPKEKRAFSPHLTLCRFKDKIPQELTNDFKSYSNGEFRVQFINQFSLIQSKLKSTGAEYTVLKNFPLRVN